MQVKKSFPKLREELAAMLESELDRTIEANIKDIAAVLEVRMHLYSSLP